MREKSAWARGYIRRKCRLLILLGTAVAGLMAAGACMQPAVDVSAAAGALSGMTILLDAGHGGYDGGACGKSGVWEKEINLQVARKTEAALHAMGAAVVMTRSTDVDLCSEPRPAELTKKRQDMIARIDLAKEHDVDMVLSIHMNFYRDRLQSGPQVFYRKGSDSGRLLAGCMQERLIDTLEPAKERAALSGDYFILQLDVPSVLIECGFLSNASEEKKLLDADYQQLIAQAIAQGAAEYAALQE